MEGRKTIRNARLGSPLCCGDTHGYKCKNEIRCRDDTVPKTVDTRSHCKVWLRACNNLPQPPPYILVFGGCGRLLHALNHTLQWLFVSTVFGMVSSLHLISFLMIFTLVYTAVSVMMGILKTQFYTVPSGDLRYSKSISSLLLSPCLYRRTATLFQEIALGFSSK